VATIQITVQRTTIVSSKPFEQVTASLEAAVGHPDMRAFFKDVSSSKTYPEVEGVVHKAVAASGFMQFARFDLGEVLRKELGDKAPRSLRYLVGNPLIMKAMVEHVPDAGSYAPVTILVDEHPDGVHLSYDTMVSYLAPYGNPDASKVAQDLDAKVAALLASAAG
jgi:uncharacterized protein (DUF302 family)